MKIWLIVATVVLSLFFLLPSFLAPDSPALKYLPGKKLNLGLDLRGGIHVVLGVDVRKALEVETDNLVGELKRRLEEENLTTAVVEREPGTRRMFVTLNDRQQSGTLEKVLKDNFYQRLVLTAWASNLKAEIQLEQKHADDLAKMSLEQAREIIRNRIDEFGVAEPVIQLQGSDRILVQLPGVSDPDRALQLIGKTALLEYKIVDDSMSSAQLLQLVEKHRTAAGFTNNFTKAQLTKLNEFVKSEIPAGTVLSFEKEVDRRGGDVRLVPYIVKAKTELTGSALENARVTSNQTNQRPQVSLTFTKDGAETFEKITADNVGKRLAIVLDDVVISAPVIQEKIPAVSRGATVSLGMGDHNKLINEAKDLALVLRSGALPAPVEILENRTVGASLGEDSIQKGGMAGLIASLLIILFMIIYYRACGLLADAMLIVNILMLLAVMALFQATLTMPGIAGIVITVGNAVDANVVIYERIREELRRNKDRVRTAIEMGFQGANNAILDSNMATLIAGIVLFNFGTGPIKGFAVTLLIGIICSYIAQVWFSKWIFEWLLNHRPMKTISI